MNGLTNVSIAELNRLRAENARLSALLDAHGIEWRMPESAPLQPVIDAQDPSRFTTEEKIALFRRLFRGRTDVYPLRWESKSGKSGYSPACANEWKAGICAKPRIKCSDCAHRVLLLVSDAAIYAHLADGIRLASIRCCRTTSAFSAALFAEFKLDRTLVEVHQKAMPLQSLLRNLPPIQDSH